MRGHLGTGQVPGHRRVGPNGEAWSVFDANWPTDLVNGLPYGGGMFWDSLPSLRQRPRAGARVLRDPDSAVHRAGHGLRGRHHRGARRKDRLDAATLTATVDRYNGMCEAGEDTDYYKKPVFLTPVKQGPFYALKVGPALLAVCGGLKCNNDFQCLDENGEVIEGLYVLGNIIGDVAGGGATPSTSPATPTGRAASQLRVPARPRTRRGLSARARNRLLRCGLPLPAAAACRLEKGSLRRAFLFACCQAALPCSILGERQCLTFGKCAFLEALFRGSYAGPFKKAHFPSHSRPLLG